MSDYLSNHRYKIIFKYINKYDSIDYVFLAPDDVHASAIILQFDRLYKIEHVYKYNQEKKIYMPVKHLEDKYVKKQ